LTKTEEKNTITSTAQADPLISKRILSKQAEPPLTQAMAVAEAGLQTVVPSAGSGAIAAAAIGQDR